MSTIRRIVRSIGEALIRATNIKCPAPLSPVSREIEAKFWACVDTSGPCFLWSGGITKQGYGSFTFWDGLRRRTVKAHRLAWEMTHGAQSPKIKVIHTGCTVRNCVNLAHLSAGSTADIMALIKQRGTKNPPRGERSGTAKLSRTTVHLIKTRLASGSISQRGLAKELGVSPSTVANIVHGRTWLEN
jgi:hypothetical protein